MLRASPDTLLVNFDWGEKSKTIRLAINQDKVRQSGLSSDAVAQAIQKGELDPQIEKLQEDRSKALKKPSITARAGSAPGQACVG